MALADFCGYKPARRGKIFQALFFLVQFFLFLFKENFYQGLDMDDFCMETTNIEANSQLMLPPFSQVCFNVNSIL